MCAYKYTADSRNFRPAVKTVLLRTQLSHALGEGEASRKKSNSKSITGSLEHRRGKYCLISRFKDEEIIGSFYPGNMPLSGFTAKPNCKENSAYTLTSIF